MDNKEVITEVNVMKDKFVSKNGHVINEFYHDKPQQSWCKRYPYLFTAECYITGKERNYFIDIGKRQILHTGKGDTKGIMSSLCKVKELGIQIEKGWIYSITYGIKPEAKIHFNFTGLIATKTYNKKTHMFMK